MANVAATELTRAGFAVSPDIIGRFFAGRRPIDMLVDIETATQRKLPANFATTLAAATLRRLKVELRATAHVEHALTWLRGPKCVASSSPLDRVRVSLESTGMLRFFEPHLFSANDVPSGKPAPDLFLHVAAKMRVKPADCIVVEDLARRGFGGARRRHGADRIYRRQPQQAASRRAPDQRRRARRDRRYAGAEEHGRRTPRLVTSIRSCRPGPA